MAPGTECRVTEQVNKLVPALPGVKQIGIYCRKSAPFIINDSILKFYQKLIIHACFYFGFPFSDVYLFLKWVYYKIYIKLFLET